MKRVPGKDRQRARTPEPVPVVNRPIGLPAWQKAVFIMTALALAIWAYSPAFYGEFVFDDLHLPIMQQGAMAQPLSSFLGLRPLLMFTYWLNLHTNGLDTLPYHLVNFCFHLIASVLLYFVVRKILTLAEVLEPRRTTISALCCAIFLLHPMQTEAVSYIAQRGESMGAMFFFAAWCLFLYRRRAEVSWPVAAGVLALYGAAAATKEHTVTLPAVLLLTDFFFHPDHPGLSGIRRNWRLYLPIAAGAAIGAVLVIRIINRDATSIGFNLKDFTWYQYLFTEWRVFFVYLGLFLLPVWQTIDYDFAISHSPLDHGAVFYLLAILALTGAAVYVRKRFPLASFGFLLFVLMLLPTSSVIPIRDVVADRRLYLPMTGLLFICAEFLRRFRYNQALTAVLMVLLAVGTFSRNQVWASSLAIWRDAAEKSPRKQRVQFGLAVAEFRAGHCPEAVEHYRRSAELEKPDYMLLMNWSLAYDCDHQPDKAIEMMRQSIRDKPTAQAWASLGYLYARQGKADDALGALTKAQVIDAAYPTTYLYRARILAAMDRVPDAIRELNYVLTFDPSNQNALNALAQLKGQAH